MKSRDITSFRLSVPLLLVSLAAATSLFSFLTQAISVRVLPIDEFGMMVSSVAVLGLIGVAAGSIQATTVHKLIVPQKSADRRVLLQTLIVSVASCATFLLTTFLIRVPVATGIIVSLWVPIAIVYARAIGELQARERQVLIQVVTVGMTSLTLLLTYLLSFSRLSVDTLLFVRMFSTLLAIFLILVYLKLPVKRSFDFFHSRLSISFLVVSTSWIISNFDILLSRIFLSSVASGQIAMAALLVNSSLLFPGLIAMILYPKLLQDHNNKYSMRLNTVKAISVSFLVQSIACVVLINFGEAFIRRLSGSDVNTMSSIITQLSFCALPIGVMIILVQLLLAKGTWNDVFIFLGTTGAAITYIWNQSSDVNTFGRALLIAVTFQLAALVVQTELILRYR
jgi:O-antigen/teichoic acid export membrane protein